MATNAARKQREYPKPPLTSGGKQRAHLRSDAPRALQALAATQVPSSMRGPAMRGAFMRGWCDGVRGLKATRNPYRRAGSGFHHGMAALYAEGWVAGKRIARVDSEPGEMTQAAYDRAVEVRNRVRSIERGELLSPAAAAKGQRRVRL